MGIGTETGGSNIFPASLGGLYSLTLSHGSVPMDGVCRVSKTFDRIGTMARDPRSCFTVKALVRLDGRFTEPLKIEATPSDSVWGSLSIGVLDSEWGTDPSSQWKWGSSQVVSLRRWSSCLD